MKVTIITVCYNSELTIADTINSVLTQSYKDIEYIVVDGDSTDNTVSLVKSFGDKISKFLSEKDCGIYDAMNKGLSLATGNIIGFINADDVINSSDCIAEIVNTFKENEVDIVYGDKLYTKENDLTKIVRTWNAGELKLSNYKKGWMTPHLSTYIKKSVYDKYGVFNLDLKISADYELMLRFIYKHKVKTKYINKIIAKMRLGGVSTRSFKNILRSNIEVYKAWKVNDLKVTPFIILNKPIKKLVQYFS